MELLRTHLAAELGDEAAGRLLPPLVGHPTAPAAGRLAGELLRELPRPPRGLGSNEWAIAGSRTASGLPLLANDPHLLVQQPGAWIELHLRAPGYEARGVAAPFAPGIVLGTTAHHAWGATNVAGRAGPLFERMNDEARQHATRTPGAPHDPSRADPRSRDDEPLVHRSGPPGTGRLLESYLTGRLRPAKHPLEGAFALRWVGPPQHPPAALIDSRNVTTFDGFRDAARALECPGQNLVYADVDGTIGYQCTGLHPIRAAGDGTVPVPGWTAEHEWQGFVPFEELPSSVDPGRGFLVTANDRIHADDYPHVIGLDFHAPDRAARITELLGSGATTRSRRPPDPADTVPLGAVAGTTDRDRARTRPRILDGWDRDVAAGSAAAALWEVFLDELARRALGGREPLIEEYLTDRELFRCRALPAMIEEGVLTADDRDDALAAAWDRCIADMGPDPEDWRWGDIHRARFAHPLGRMPGLEPLFVAADHALGGNEQTVNNAGFEGEGPFRVYVVPSWRVVYDLSDLDASAGILPTGQSGNPASPHWNDQTEPWAAGTLRPLPFSRAAVEAAATERLALLPG